MNYTKKLQSLHGYSANMGVGRTSIFTTLFLISSAILISSGPIYWLPGLSLPAMSWIKNIAFFSAIIFAIFISKERIVKLDIIFLFFIAAFFNFLAFQINGSEGHATYQALIFLAPMAWVLALRSLRPKHLSVAVKYLPVPLAIITLAVGYGFFAKFGIFSDIRPPLEGLHLVEREIAGFQRMTVSTVGFAFGRTGWGTGTSMALVLLGSILIGRRKHWLGLAILLLAVLAPAAMGARGAALGAIAAAMFALITMRQLGYYRVFLAIIITVIPIAAIEYLAEAGLLSNRFFNIHSNSDLFFTLDEVSTGRLGTWVHAARNFFDSPLTGVGVEASRMIRHTGEVVGVHNVWLGLLSEGGLMSFIPAIVIFMWAAHSIWRVVEFRPLLILVIFISMLEPSVVFGTFGNQITFWTAVGLSRTNAYRNLDN
ncbi:MAG: hypothetical protein ACXIVO_01945 [Glycocaulis sp.]